MSALWSTSELFAILTLGLGGPLLGLARWMDRAVLGYLTAALLTLSATLAAVAGLSFWAVLPAGSLAVGHLLASVISYRRAEAARLQAAIFLTVGPLLAVAVLSRHLIIAVSDAAPWVVVTDSAAPTPGSDERGMAGELRPASESQLAPLLPELHASNIPACTDGNRPVQLLSCPVKTIRPESQAAWERRWSILFPAANRVTQPEPSYNCHGWIFAGGRYWLDDSAIEWILTDNDYVVTNSPRPGDVVIYRTPEGVAIHSGIVRKVQGDSLQVESKWGGWHRYLHPIADQPYSDRWNIYRTKRTSHVIRIGEAETGPIRITPK